MIPFRTQVKFFFENPQTINTALFMGVFQRWIQQNALKELLIDVADYRHVFEGPGIVLIGHYSDYAIENRDGRLGLLYTRKRQAAGDLQTQLRASFQWALTAAELLEAETAFDPRLKFRADEIEIRFADRLRLPNTPESFGQIKDDLQVVLTDLYGGKATELTQSQPDPRALLTIGVRAEGAVSIADSFRSFQLTAES
jgi:hypothetical protein